MLYKVGPFGYFSRTTKISRGPWFEHHKVEDDGLEYYYSYSVNGEKFYLLSNNIPIEDRERINQFYHGISRHQNLAWFAGLWLGVESVMRCGYFRRMAWGWRIVSVFGIGLVFKNLVSAYHAMTYGPIVSAFFRKHGHGQAKNDLFDIKDAKREYFYIDTSQYMNYDFNDLGHEYHMHHGPQPDGEVLDSTWLIEMDKFLRGEPNHLKEHKLFQNYTYEYIDKSYPTSSMAHDVFHAALAK